MWARSLIKYHQHFHSEMARLTHFEATIKSIFDAFVHISAMFTCVIDSQILSELFYLIKNQIKAFYGVATGFGGEQLEKST